MSSLWSSYKGRPLRLSFLFAFNRCFCCCCFYYYCYCYRNGWLVLMPLSHYRCARCRRVWQRHWSILRQSTNRRNYPRVPASDWLSLLASINSDLLRPSHHKQETLLTDKLSNSSLSFSDQTGCITYRFDRSYDDDSVCGTLKMTLVSH